MPLRPSEELTRRLNTDSQAEALKNARLTVEVKKIEGNTVFLIIGLFDWVTRDWLVLFHDGPYSLPLQPGWAAEIVFSHQDRVWDWSQVLIL